MSSIRRFVGALAVLAAVTAALAAVAVFLGAAPISPGGVVRALVGLGGDVESLVVLGLRLPRIAAALLAGAALAVAGAGFQALTRNPLADPAILGVSGGAAFGVVVAQLMGFGTTVVAALGLTTAAFAGALVSAVVVYLIAARDGQLPLQTLLLAGVIVGLFFSAAITVLISIVEFDRLAGVIHWMLGNLRPLPGGALSVFAALVAGGLWLILDGARQLNLLALGEESARQLGVEGERLKRRVFVGASLLTAVVVAFAGPIGFVGLIVPHGVRLVLGPDNRMLVPAALLAGAGFLLAADTLARSIIAPGEMPVGVITAFCGAPFFVYLLRSRHLMMRADGEPRSQHVPRDGSASRSREARRGEPMNPDQRSGVAGDEGAGTTADTGLQTSLVQFRDVSFAYPEAGHGQARRFRLAGITFDVLVGEILAVIGPNSAGKTTLIRLLSGVVTSLSGAIRVEGRPLAAMSAAEIARRVAVVPQDLPPDLPFTVAEMVLMGRYPHDPGRFFESDVDRARCRSAMAEMGVLELASLPVNRLSGGERQRAVLARALAQEPRLLVLDEPTTHLDLRYQAEMIALVRRLQRTRGLTTLIVSHDLNLAAEVGDRVLLLHEGQVERIGTPEAVFDETTLARVYGCPVVVEKHPTTRRPAVHIAWPEGGGTNTA
jgi:iron complex transport system permease protein